MRSCMLLFVVVLMIQCTNNSTQTTEMSEDDHTITFAENDSTKTYVLKWEDVSNLEDLMLYQLVDQDNNDMIINRIEVEGFDADNNEYFSRTEIEGTPFYRYKIKDAAMGQWYDVSVMTTQEENDLAGDGSTKEVKVMLGIQPHNY